MKNILQVCTFFLLLAMSNNTFAQGGWTQLSTSYSGNFKDVHFVSATTGFAVGGNNSTGIIYKTTNGGTTWASTSISTSSLESVWFTSATVGYVSGSNGKIYKTTNGGTSWLPMVSGTTVTLNTINFPTATAGYAAGSDKFLKTSNSGALWTIVTIPTGINTINTRSVFFTSSNVGFACGDYNFLQGFINITTNSGATWSLTPFTSPGKLYDLHFPSSTVGYAVGASGGIYKTSNGGTSWVAKTSGVIADLHGVYFVSTTVGYAVGDSGVVLKTTNGGTNWTRQTTNVQNHLQNVSAPSSTLAFVVGDNNKILKTTSGGVSLTVNVPDDSVYCDGYTNLHAYTSYNGIGTLSYTWNASPYLSSTTDSIVTAGPLTNNQTFIVTVSDGSISHSDTVLVQVIPLPTDSICIVAVDSANGHPIVVFEKQISGPIQYYKIYRESNVAGIYDSIGFLPPDSAGVFVDTSSNVIVRQYSYKISNVDSCGNESVTSAPHKTMHLQVNAGAGSTWNLLWSHYEGVFVQSYEIWRGVDTINMSLVGTVPGSNNSYTDLTPPSGGLYYFVRIVSAYICQPYNYKANTNYNSSRSNRANNGLVNPPISADFSATPLSGNTPLNVQFQDATTGVPTSFMWYFGDGNTSTLQNPSHTYNANGKYTVKLVVNSNTIQDSIEKTDYITVGPIGFDEIDLNKHLRIYPNPLFSNAVLFIDFEQVQITDIQLIDIVGKAVRVEIVWSPNRIEVKTHNLSSGIYFIKLTSSTNDVIMRKIIVK